ncbi:MAG TPA: hypothetical protein VIG69_04530 [Candidatus Methylomirabilis sp.]
MRNRWMAYAMAAALGLGTVGEALAQAPGGAVPPAPAGPPAVQKQDVQKSKATARGKQTGRRRGKKARSKQAAATGPQTQAAQPAATQPR